MLMNPEFKRYCLDFGNEFKEPVMKTIIESSTFLPSGVITVEEASDVLVSPCCSAGYSMYYGDGDDEGNDEVGTISGRLNRSDFVDPFAE